MGKRTLWAMVNYTESQPEDGEAAAGVAEEASEIVPDNPKHTHPNQGTGGIWWRRALGVA